MLKFKFTIIFEFCPNYQQVTNYYNNKCLQQQVPNYYNNKCQIFTTITNVYFFWLFLPLVFFSFTSFTPHNRFMLFFFLPLPSGLPTARPRVSFTSCTSSTTS